MLDKIKKIIKKEEPKKKSDNIDDISYLENSSEAVGYDNREIQWNVYRTVLQYIPEQVSILDFGCGRGDLYSMHKSEYGEVDYVGVDFNEPLITAGKKIYPDISDKLILSDWSKLSSDIIKDWCVNVGSNNLRYDTNLNIDNFTYTCKTLEVMYRHAKDGIVALFTSGTNLGNGLISHDGGKLFNWAQNKFGNVILDHSIAEDGFCLIIKKIQK